MGRPSTSPESFGKFVNFGQICHLWRRIRQHSTNSSTSRDEFINFGAERDLHGAVERDGEDHLGGGLIVLPLVRQFWTNSSTLRTNSSTFNEFVNFAGRILSTLERKETWTVPSSETVRIIVGGADLSEASCGYPFERSQLPPPAPLNGCGSKCSG